MNVKQQIFENQSSFQGGEMRYKQVGIPIPDGDTVRNLRTWLPSRGNVIFTTLMIMLLVWAQTVGAFPALNSTSNSTGTIAYQGRLADSGGNPLTTTVNMTFRLYSTATGGSPLWQEDWTGSNGVQVSDGLFNVMLGSLTAIPQNVITGNPTLFLGITAGTDDEMSPRVQLGSVPFAVQALTVPNGSVTTPKLADKSVTQAKLGSDISLVPPDGSITTAKIADQSITREKQAPRQQIIMMQFGNDGSGGVSTLTHLGYMVRFAPGHSLWARAVTKLPPDWVPGTPLRIAAGAQSSANQTIAPRVCWATLNSTSPTWDVCAELSPNVTLTAGLADITLKTILANEVSVGDTISIAFQFPNNTHMIDVTGVYLEYTARP
ncbi:MAG: hypothetical protein WAU10_09830 [Caldilineaceae bacterium]